jgi:hypothetical protein
MTRPNDTSISTQDEKLADFTDRILNDQAKEIESNVDKELHDLEETVLHLKSTLPSASLDEATAKQMLVRLKARIRRESSQARQPFLKKWFGTRRTQFALAAAAVALLILIGIVTPWLSTAGSSTTATALTSTQSFVIGIALSGVILYIFWSVRRK